MKLVEHSSNEILMVLNLQDAAACCATNIKGLESPRRCCEPICALFFEILMVWHLQEAAVKPLLLV